jgi:hypothetical protein
MNSHLKIRVCRVSVIDLRNNLSRERVTDSYSISTLWGSWAFNMHFITRKPTDEGSLKCGDKIRVLMMTLSHQTRAKRLVTSPAGDISRQFPLGAD